MLETLSAPRTSDLLEQVSVALQSSPYVPKQRVLVEEDQEGAVRLRGNVSSFFQKQMAQEVIRRLDGVQRIENLLEVRWT